MSRELGTRSSLAGVPGYDQLQPAGQGAMGRVYVGRQKALGRRVALKFLAFDPDADPDERLARFRREAEIMAGLSHPNVLSVIDYGEADDGRPFLVMEYVAGGDLRRRMPEGEPMPLPEALRVLRPIAEALTYLHAQGILHRDLKPENILILEDGTPKVADFGIAVGMAGSGELTRSGQGLGTLGYVAPEQQYRLPIDERADQYSLAALTYEMLTGLRPLGVFKPPSHHNPQIPEGLDEVVMKALQEHREDRFPSVQAYHEAIVDAAGRPRRPRSGRIAAVVAPGLIALIVTLAVGLLWPVPKAPPAAPDRPQAAPDRPRTVAPETPPAAPPEAPPAVQSSRFRAMVERQAEAYWKEMGSPTGEAGERVAQPNWLRAEATLTKLVKERAYALWERRGRPGGDVGKALMPELWSQAEREVARQLGLGVDDAPPK